MAADRDLKTPTTCDPTTGCCTPDPDSFTELSRRTFLALGAAGFGVLAMPGSAVSRPEDLVAVPAGKNLPEAWLHSLVARGRPTEYTGTALQRIGMPVGGGTCGQVYLAGDGRLWLWDVYNLGSHLLGGAHWTGPHYAAPLSPVSPFETGFALRTTADGVTRTRRLDATGFTDVRFVGQYPIGTVSYSDPGSPVAVTLRAYSPFVPTTVADSTLPVTVMEYTLRNTSAGSVTTELLGYAESAACVASRRQQPVRLRATGFDPPTGKGVEFSATDPGAPPRPDIVFEDWERSDYAGWTVSGTAFGSGPVREVDVPGYFKRFGSLRITGERFVTSHNYQGSGDPDGHQGRLLSRPFVVERRYVIAAISGGQQPGLGVDVVVDGVVVRSHRPDEPGGPVEPVRPVWLDVSGYEGRMAQVQIVDAATGAWAHLNCDRITFSDRPPPRPDIVFENWERTDYAGWTVTGTAFGSGPVTEAETPSYFRRDGALNLGGFRFVTSHHFRAGGDAAAADSHQGRLSRQFTVGRRYVQLRVGGGSHVGRTCVNVVVGGEVVASFTGDDREPMSIKSLDIGRYEGQTATLEIVDAHTGDWGHINCDVIAFSDVPAYQRAVADLPDHGTFALAALDSAATVRPSIADWSSADALFDSADGPTTVEGGRNTIAGTARVGVTLAPGATKTVRFVLGWHFPKANYHEFGRLQGGGSLRHHYATRFDSARAVVHHLATDGDRLATDTKRFVDTWYADSTLPYWFLERTLAPASTLATMTCYRFDDGRFYANEGLYCCGGTCSHVWNYAQSLGRLFPELERDTRERVDYGLAFHTDSGAIDYRGEVHRIVAHDGQAGTILRTYREHQMAPDAGFLQRVWPRVKQAVEYLIRHDGEPDGIFERDQYNTLDATWYGEIPWISGLYVAALRAAAEMAAELGDTAARDRYRTVADRGTGYLTNNLWNATYGYFEHRVDPAHPESINSNRGCFIDQMYGQTYAHQLGLPRVFPLDRTLTALRNGYRHNFLRDAQSYRDVSGIPGGRVYSTEGEAGTLMCTWPYGGADTAPGTGDAFAVGYFNEVWTGQEYQFAAHLLAEGLVTEGLAVTRAVHDRYSSGKRNPYNEIECSDHYTRAMMSHAVYLAASGFAYHGPKGHLGFAPRLSPEDFAAAFVSAEGWGRYRQTRDAQRQVGTVELRYGRLTVRTFAMDLPSDAAHGTVTARLDGEPAPVASAQRQGARITVAFVSPVVLTGGALEVAVALT